MYVNDRGMLTRGKQKTLYWSRNIKNVTCWDYENLMVYINCGYPKLKWTMERGGGQLLICVNL